MSDSRPIAYTLRGIPIEVMKTIFSFASGGDRFSSWDEYHTDLMPHTPNLPSRTLHRMGQVSLGWCRVVREIVSEFADTTLEFKVLNGNEEDGVSLAEKLDACADTLRDLRLCMCYKHFGRNVVVLYETLQSLERVDAWVVDWDAMFRRCPNLLRLDLSLMPLHSGHLGAILDAASTHCPQLQALILPTRELGAIDNEKLSPLFPKLYQALGKWYNGGEGGSQGLLQLTVPHRSNPEDTDLFTSADAFLTAVARFCPNIEYLDGWKGTFSENPYLHCEEMLLVSIAVWQIFCQSCTKLREFTWFIVPFDSDFLHVFQQYPKPHLTKMTIACGNEVNWPDRIPPLDEFLGGGLSFLSVDIAQMLESCPALRHLDVVFTPNSTKSEMLQCVISDVFLIAVSTHCPHLETLVIKESTPWRALERVKYITDAGLIALSKLEQLRELTMKVTQASGKGIAALLVDAAPPRNARKVTMEICCSPGGSAIPFFDVLVGLLQEIVALPAGSLHQNRCQLVLANLWWKPLENAHEIKETLESLKHRLSLQNPTVEMLYTCRGGDTTGIPEDLLDIHIVRIILASEHRYGSV